MLGRIVKFRRGDKYEDLEGEDGLNTNVDDRSAAPTSDSGVLFHRRPETAGTSSTPSKEIQEGQK